MSNIRHTLHGIYKATAEAVLPHRTQSAITDKGVGWAYAMFQSKNNTH